MEEKIRLAVFGQKRLSREGGIEIVVKELCTRMAQNGCDITCYNRAGHHVSGAEYDKTIEYDGIRQKVVPTIERKGLAAVSSSFFAALCSAFGRYDVVHIHAEGPAFFCWIPKLFGKRVISTIHGLDWAREKWKFGVGSKFIRQGEKNAVKYADEIIVLSKGVQKYFMETYGILHERERKALICFSALERQEEKLSEEKAEIVKQRVALYEQYADGNMSKEEFIRQRDAYRVQEDEKMEQIQRLRTEKNQIFQPVKKDTDNLQAVMDTVGGAGDVMHLSQNVVETFIDRIEVFNDECVKIRFTFEDVLKSYEAE